MAIAHPPALDHFTAVLKASSAFLKWRGKELLIGPDTPPDLLNDLGDALGRIERAATPIQRTESSDPACPGSGKCHGPVKWCPDCGDVGDVCDDPRCDSHAAYCERCGAYIGAGSLIPAAAGRTDICEECDNPIPTYPTGVLPGGEG